MNTYKKLGAGLMATLALSLSSLGDDHSKPELSPLNVVGSNADAPAMSSGLKVLDVRRQHSQRAFLLWRVIKSRLRE